MGTLRISLNDIPPQGQNITIDDPAVWETPLAEFHMECRITEPLRAELFMLPADGGCLVRGTLRGKVVLPCDRCAEDAHADLNHAIEVFESLPDALMPSADDEDGQEDDGVDEDASHIVMDKGVPMLDLAGLCWEEFMLALPFKPLCIPQCAGLCAQCGANLNTGPCGCVKDSGDPRLAVLRQITLQKPEK